MGWYGMCRSLVSSQPNRFQMLCTPTQLLCSGMRSTSLSIPEIFLKDCAKDSIIVVTVRPVSQLTRAAILSAALTGREAEGRDRSAIDMICDNASRDQIKDCPINSQPTLDSNSHRLKS